MRGFVPGKGKLLKCQPIKVIIILKFGDLNWTDDWNVGFVVKGFDSAIYSGKKKKYILGIKQCYWWRYKWSQFAIHGRLAMQ